jgi:hypothetical protein
MGGALARTGEIRNTYTILVGKLEMKTESQVGELY